MLHKKAQDITIDDIEKFCLQANPESSWLDYKESISHTKANDQIAKVISSLANTHGGWVLFGISEKKDALGRGLPDKIVGINAAATPGERVQQICLNAIYPPVVPEMNWCPLKDDPARGVLVIHIYESDTTPHRIGEDDVRIRVNDVTYIAEEGKRASVDEIEMLLNRRQKTLDLKNRILTRAHSRAFLKNGPAQLSTYCVPTYPDHPIADWRELSVIVGASRRWTAFSGSRTYLPAHESLVERFLRITEDGDQKQAMSEFGVHGLVYLNTIIWEGLAKDACVKARTCFTILNSIL